MEPHSEVRLVSCLFVDVIGSTDATVRLGPERMKRLLDDAFAGMSAEIVAGGGTVEKYVGDAIFALFGAPVTHADDAARALRAADACARSASVSGAGLALRIGIETGEALVDLGGVEDRQRMVVGACVNVAARLQQAADPGQIVVGPTCRAATAGIARFEALGPLNLKGVGPVESWRFAGFVDDGASVEVAFVGRDAELAALAGTFERAAVRHTAQLAVIVGPPGQGKSRVTAEAVRRSGVRRVIGVRCRPGTEAGANTPLKQLVDGDVPGPTPERVRERVASLLPEEDVAEVAAAISHSAGLAVDPRILALSRYEQRELIAESWRRYLQAVAGAEPLAVVVEDVHWADPVLLRVIDHVSAEVAAPLTVLATARPEFAGSAGLRPRADRLQIDLSPLAADDVERLAQLAGGGSSAATALDRSGGNPLFVIELARARSRAGDVPVTLQAAIAARLDELAPADRGLLQSASVVGETFDARDAALLGDRTPVEVAAALGQIAHLGFVTHVGSAYRFHHALVHDVAYGRLPVAERMALHARYAVEGVDQDDAEALAHHWWEAVRPPDAAWVWDEAGRLDAMRRTAYRVHLAAGRRLEERNADEEALEIHVRALELADETADRAAAEGAIGRGFARQGRGDDAWSHRLAAIELYRQTGAPPPAQLYADMLEIATFNWGYFTTLPSDEQVLALLTDGIHIARESGDELSLARLLAERAAYTNDLAGTEEITSFLGSRDQVRFADAAQRMGTVLAWAGRVRDAVSTFETVFDVLIPAGAQINEPEGLTWYGLAAFMAGDLERADALADRLGEEAGRRSVHTRSHAHSLKALVQFGRGDRDALARTVADLRSLADGHPETPLCLLSAAALGYGAARHLLGGGELPADLDAQAKRCVEGSERVQDASVMLPKVMAGDGDALARGLRGYEAGLRLRDRYRAWDVADIGPGIALTMLERWTDLSPVLERLDQFAGAGSRLASAVAAAIREEEAASHDGPASRHEELLRLGYTGISDLLRYRPPSAATRAAPSP